MSSTLKVAMRYGLFVLLLLAAVRGSFAEDVPLTACDSLPVVQVSVAGMKFSFSDFVIGVHHLRNLTLSAVDLSAIGRACGHAIDGILGIDLLRRLGAVVDLNDHVARLLVDSETAQSRVAELDQRLALCTQAFNSGGEQVLSDCLDPRVVLFTAIGDSHRREAFMEYLRRQRGSQRSLPQLVITPRAHHLFGEEM